MSDKFKSTINGGIPLCKATNLAGAVQPMIPQLKAGNACYLKRSDQTGAILTFRGFPPEITAHNALGDIVDVPDWGQKALRILGY